MTIIRMQPHLSAPSAPSIIDLGKKRAKREAVPSSGCLPLRPLVDHGKKGVRHAVRPVPPTSPDRKGQTVLVWLGLAAFGVMLWAFYAARNPIPAPAVATSVTNKAPATPVKTADEAPQLGTLSELSQGAELSASVLKEFPAEAVRPSPMPAIKYEGKGD